MRVLDASALLALLLDEPGSDRVQGMLPEVAVSAVNLSEVAAKLCDHGVPSREAERILGKLGLRIEPFTEKLAFEAAGLRRATRPAGLSLGDRACLATARELSVSAVTADRAWAALSDALEVDIELIR